MASGERTPSSVPIAVPVLLWVIAPWVLSALALAIRLYHLGREPLWFDEAYTALTAVKPVAEIVRLLQGEGNAPLYYLLLHVWTLLFGDSELALRFVSAVSGAATVPVIYWIGARMFSRPAGMIGAALAAVCPLQVHYSQEVRMYAMVPLLALVLLYTLYRLIVAPNAAAFIGFVLSTVAGLYVHYYFLFLLPLAGFALVAAERGRALRWVAGALLLVGIGFAPWLPTFLHQASGGVEDWVTEWWRGRPFWYAIPWSLETLGPGAQYPPMANFKFPSSVYARAVSLSLAALVLGGAAAQLSRDWRERALRRVSGQAWRRRQKQGLAPDEAKPSARGAARPANEFAGYKYAKSPCGDSPSPTCVPGAAFESGVGSPRRWAWRLDSRGFNRRAGAPGEGEPAVATALTLSAVLIPLLIAFVLSLVRSPIYVVGRHDMIVWGAYYLLAGAVLSRLRPRVAAAAVAAWMGLSLFTLVPYFTTDRPKRNFADLGNVIAPVLVERVHPDEMVVFTALTRTMTQYYLRASAPRLRLVSYPLGTDAHLGWTDPRIRMDPAFGAQAARQFVTWLADEGPLPPAVWVVAPASRGTPQLLAELKRLGYRSDPARSTGLLVCLRRG